MSSAPTLTPSTLNCTPATVLPGAVAVAVRPTVPDTVDPAAGAVIVAVGGALLTVKETALEVTDGIAAFVLRTVAVRLCVPFATVVEFHATEYGEVVSSAPTLTPSTLNCTPAMVAPVVVAESATEAPETVAPAVGAVTVTDIELSTVTATPTEVAAGMAAFELRTVAVTVWPAFVAPVEFHVVAVRRGCVLDAHVHAVHLELHAGDLSTGGRGRQGHGGT